MMDFFKGFSLTTVNGVPLTLLLTTLSAFVVYYFYKNIYPPKSKSFRIILRTLRSLVFIFLSIQLSMVVINWSTLSEKKKVVGILLDGSKSMAQYENNPFIETVEMVHRITSAIGNEVEVKKYIFDSELRDLSADDRAEGDLTDISKSLKKLLKENRSETVSAVILLSDGQWNQGEPPDLKSNFSAVPIHVVGIGKKEKSRDIRISSVNAKSVMFLGDSMKITLSLLSDGFSGKNAEIRVYGEGISEKIKNISLPEDGFLKDVDFYLSFDSEGEKNLQIELSNLEGESTYSNNRRRKIINVISKKKNLLLLGGAPSAEYVFVKDLLNSREEFDVTSMVQSGNNKWYERGTLLLESDFDLFIFVGFPSDQSSENDIGMLLQELTGKPVSLLFINSGSTDFDKLGSFESFLPVRSMSVPGAVRYNEGNLKLEDDGKFHPFTKQSDFLSETLEAWHNMPPAYFPLLSWKLKETSKVLMSIETRKINSDTNFPALIVSGEGPKKSAMIMTVDSRNFDRLLRAVGEPSSTWKNTLINGVKWLSSSELPKRINVVTEKKIYSQGEKIRFTAQVYDDSYNLIDDANLSVEIKFESDMSKVFEFDLQNRANGSYIGEYRSKQPGEFYYKAVAKRGDILIGEFEGKFGVETYSPEFDNLFRNEKLLKSIAEKSGGIYYPFESFNPDSLNIASDVIIEKSDRTFEAWSNQILMFILLSLLAVEWYMRKRGGLL